MSHPRLPSARDRRDIAGVLAASLIYAGACAAAGWFGYAETRFQWDLFQMLDRQALASAPWTSLLLLHNQPPLLNLLAAASLWLGETLGCPPARVVTELFYLVGLLATLCTYLAVKNLTGAMGWALLACAALVLDPGFHLFRTLYFYPWLMQAALAALLLASVLYLRSGRARPLWAATLLLGVVVNTRSLFHPLWALGFLLLLVLAARRTTPGGGPRLRSVAAPLLVLLLLLAAWPLKNRVLFGQFTFSSLSGFNLSRDLPVDRTTLHRYLSRAEVPPASQARADRLASRYGQAAGRVVAATTKSTGQRNWNHLLMLELSPDLAMDSMRWRARNVGAWLRRASFYYRRWSLSTYLNPYDQTPMGAGTSRFLSYHRLWSGALYADLKPLGRWLRYGSGQSGRGAGSKLPFTLFGYLLLPALMLLSLALAIRRWPRRRCSDAAALVCLYCLAWVLVVPCLSDGHEGNRMRFGAGPMMLALGCYLLAWLSDLLRRALRLRRSAAPRPG